MSNHVREARRRGLKVYSRKQWGSQHRALYFKRLITHPTIRGKFDTVWQHISVTFDDGKLTGDFFADMREVERIGFERFGSGFSYTVGFDKDSGRIGLGMPIRAKGTHTVNHKNIRGFSYDQNRVSLAFVMIGVPGDVPSDECVQAMGEFLAVLIDTGKVTLDPDYKPHRLVAAKACPTDAVVAVMPKVWDIAMQHSKLVKKDIAKKARLRGRSIGG